MKRFPKTLSNNSEPSKEEHDAAILLGDYFHAEVTFIPTGTIKTPDFVIMGQKWELKTPRGKGKYTIQHQFQRASKQSDKIIIDIRQMPGNEARILSEISRQAGIIRTIKSVLVILKSSKIKKVK